VPNRILQHTSLIPLQRVVEVGDIVDVDVKSTPLGEIDVTTLGGMGQDEETFKEDLAVNGHVVTTTEDTQDTEDIELEGIVPTTVDDETQHGGEPLGNTKNARPLHLPTKVANQHRQTQLDEANVPQTGGDVDPRLGPHTSGWQAGWLHG